MTIEQVSVFLENAPGTLASVTRLLAQEGFDLLALSLADTAQYGLLRCLVSKPDEAVAALTNGGFSARKTPVIAVLVPDRPGGLAEVLGTLTSAGVSVEYGYSFARLIPTGKDTSGAAIVLRVEQVDEAVAKLTAAGVSLISPSELISL